MSHYKVIFHVDLNAFFASASQLCHPSYCNKPLVVCRNSRGAVVTTASYEARAFGINSAMPLANAKVLCPQLVVVEPDFSHYQRLSEQFKQVLLEFSPLVEKASIDECFIDVTEKIKEFQKPLDLAVLIQNTIKQRLSLPCSIGVGPSKFLAKMASDMRKPMGITVLRKREIKTKLWPLPIEHMLGVGKVSQARLKRVGIKTIGDFANVDLNQLIKGVEPSLLQLQQKALGNDSGQVVVEHVVKSISASNSIFEGIADYQSVCDLIYQQCQDIEAKRARHLLKATTLTMTISFDKAKTNSYSQSQADGFDNFQDIYQTALWLFDQVSQSGYVTYLGFSLNHLSALETDKLVTLFNYQQAESIDEVIDKINHLFDSQVLRKGI